MSAPVARETDASGVNETEIQHADGARFIVYLLGLISTGLVLSLYSKATSRNLDPPLQEDSVIYLIFFTSLIGAARLGLAYSVSFAFGFSTSSSKRGSDALVKLFYSLLSLMVLIHSDDPFLNVCLAGSTLVALVLGMVLDGLVTHQFTKDPIVAPIRWIWILGLIVVMANVVGNGYPANPLETIELVRLMHDPFTGIAIWLLFLAFGFSANGIFQKRKERHALG